MENGYYIIDNVRFEIPSNQKKFELIASEGNCLSELKCPESLEVLTLNFTGNEKSKLVQIDLELNANLKQLSMLYCAITTL